MNDYNSVIFNFKKIIDYCNSFIFTLLSIATVLLIVGIHRKKLTFKNTNIFTNTLVHNYSQRNTVC